MIQGPDPAVVAALQERERALREQEFKHRMEARMASLRMPSPANQAMSQLFRVDEPFIRKPAIDPAKLEALKTVEPHRVQPRMPDLTDVITAWRAWGVTGDADGYRLKALGKSHVWEPKQQLVATCDGGMLGSGKHPAPAFNCQCGIWAFKELDGLVAAVEKYSDIKVFGKVSLWGRVVETTVGYRAQIAYPSELWILGGEDMEELGLIYNVPVRTIPKEQGTGG